MARLLFAMAARVTGVCTWAAPSKPLSLFSGLRGKSLEKKGDLVPLSGEQGTVFVRESFFQDLSQHHVSAQAALIAPRPLLVVHGSNDSVVPAENAQAIYDAAGEPKRIRIIAGADHQFTGRHIEVWATFFHWLDEYFPQI